MENKKEKQRFARIIKRPYISDARSLIIRVIAFVFSFIVVSILLLCMHFNPFNVFVVMLKGAFGKEFLIRETVKGTIPLVITATGLSLAFRMKFWNIGGEGQILIGGIAATAVSFIFGRSIPQWVLLSLMAAASIIMAGLYGMIPAVFKAKFKTNETLLTLMFNYIATQLIVMLQNTRSWQDAANNFPKVRMLDFYSRLPRVFGVHIGWIIALVMLVLYYFYIQKTKHGYEIKVIGDSMETARYAGINASKVMIRTMFLSAALCGLAGFLQVAGADGTLSESTAGGVGFTAIMVAWMADMKPVRILIMSAFIAILNRGAGNLQTVYLIPSSFANIMIGIILLFMLGCEFFIKYKVSFSFMSGRKSSAINDKGGRYDY